RAVVVSGTAPTATNTALAAAVASVSLALLKAALIGGFRSAAIAIEPPTAVQTTAHGHGSNATEIRTAASVVLIMCWVRIWTPTKHMPATAIRAVAMTGYSSEGGGSALTRAQPSTAEPATTTRPTVRRNARSVSLSVTGGPISRQRIGCAGSLHVRPGYRNRRLNRTRSCQAQVSRCQAQVSPRIFRPPSSSVDGTEAKRDCE